MWSWVYVEVESWWEMGITQVQRADRLLVETRSLRVRDFVPCQVDRSKVCANDYSDHGGVGLPLENPG